MGPLWVAAKKLEQLLNVALNMHRDIARRSRGERFFIVNVVFDSLFIC